MSVSVLGEAFAFYSESTIYYYYYNFIFSIVVFHQPQSNHNRREECNEVPVFGVNVFFGPLV